MERASHEINVIACSIDTSINGRARAVFESRLQLHLLYYVGLVLDCRIDNNNESALVYKHTNNGSDPVALYYPYIGLIPYNQEASLCPYSLSLCCNYYHQMYRIILRLAMSTNAMSCPGYLGRGGTMLEKKWPPHARGSLMK